MCQSPRGRTQSGAAIRAAPRTTSTRRQAIVSTTVTPVPAPPYDPRSVLTRAGSLPDVVLRVADHEDGVADVWLPPLGFGADVGPSPLLYALHGGFWGPDYDRRHLRPLAQALCRQGWAVVLPEYARTGGRRLAAGLAAPWPLVVDDLRTVRRRVPQLLAEVAPGRVDTGRPVLVGHSAGGQLALWWALDAGSEHSWPDEQRPSHVLALAPVADLARAHHEHLGNGAVEALLGARPDPDQDTDQDTDRDTDQDADVAARLRAGQRPDAHRLILLHGADDDAVPVSHSVDLAGDVADLDLRVLAEVEHFGLIDPLSPAWPAVLDALPAIES